MKIKTGGMDLLESETFLAFGTGETVIEVKEGQECLRFILNFVEVAGEKAISLNYEAVGDNTLKIILTNWSNSLSATLMEPVEIGTYEKRRLFMLFRISKSGQKVDSREVTFSLYLGEEVQDGKN